MSWNDLLDVSFVAILLWAALVWLRRSRARFALLGVAIVGLADEFGIPVRYVGVGEKVEAVTEGVRPAAQSCEFAVGVELPEL